MNIAANPIKINRSKFFLFFGLPWIFFGLIFIPLAIQEFNTNQKFNAESRKANAILISKRQETRWNSSEKRNDIYYYLKYKFKPTNAAEITNEVSTFEDEWNKYQEGGAIEIEYLPQDPSSNRVAGSGDNVGAYLMAGFGSIMLLIGSLFSGIDIKKRLVERSIRKNGIETTGTVTSVRTGSLKVNNVSQMIVSYTFKDRIGRSYSGQTGHIKPRYTKGITNGSMCKVYYDKDDPSKNLLDSL